MRRILSKWYMSMFIIPILLTYSTNYIKLPVIFANWQLSIIFSLIILSLILIYEIFLLKRIIASITIKPKKSDKKIIKKLLETLDVNKFQEDIVNQDAWNGYFQDNIHRILDFKRKAKLINYRTSDDKLNKLIDKLVLKIDKFTEYSSLRLYGKGNWLVPFKDNPDVHPREKVKKETDFMNILTQNCFFELEILIKYLREREYL